MKSLKANRPNGGEKPNPGVKSQGGVGTFEQHRGAVVTKHGPPLIKPIELFTKKGLGTTTGTVQDMLQSGAEEHLGLAPGTIKAKKLGEGAR